MKQTEDDRTTEMSWKLEPLRETARLRVDALGEWMAAQWIAARPGQDWQTLHETPLCVHQQVLARLDRALALPGGFTFGGEQARDCPALVTVARHDDRGEIGPRTGAFVLRFAGPEGATIEVLAAASYYNDEGDTICLACVPAAFTPTWAAFVEECIRLHGALEPQPKVRIIGGRSDAFVPDTDWDDIILPPELKQELLRDVESFFDKGIAIYKRLKLKPFRKLMLAGVPGTGKTMICAALARWAIARDYVVIYVSSADQFGPAFWKIEAALEIAAESRLPAVILLEEIDAYLRNEDEKSLVLNVLDGVEARENGLGTLLIATTNYPEAIDERVIKRPGRLDRLFIIPETRSRGDAEKLLRHYLGDLWCEEHGAIAGEMVGYPGAFIREVAIYAMTQAAYADLPDLPLEVLEMSFTRLLDQITARDDFLRRHAGNGFGFVVAAKG